MSGISDFELSNKIMLLGVIAGFKVVFKFKYS